ncbi:MAG: large subunit ribosomal protein [Solirubrobacteraceae bacterium]|jgi:large subunit ribosomal protein L10|nr:large subunit ribosomal protein [Solirubrobacteraceae bacterium]
MNKEEKAAVVDQIADELKGSEAIFAVDYRGISVPQAAELRGRLREADASFRIVKNRLTLRAAEQAGTQGLDDLLEGPTALTFVRGDAAVAAKALNDFGRATDILEFKGGLLGEQVLTIDEIKSIARLPARDILHGQLVGMIAAPITGVVRGLNALLTGIAIQLQAIHDQGLVTGEAPAEAPPAEAPEESTPAEEAPGPADSPPAEETAPAQDTPAGTDGEAGGHETVTESAAADSPAGDDDPVTEGDSASSAAGPEGEHTDEPAEGPPEETANETEEA